MSKKVTISPKPAPVNPDTWVSGQPAKAKMKRFTFDVTPELHQRVKLACVAKGVEIADEMRRILEERFPKNNR